MSPNSQLQVFNPATGQFVQIDGGFDSNSALMLQILLQLVEMNQYLRGGQLAQVVPDESTVIRAGALQDTSMFQTG